jgi:hypothetical protein
MNKELKEWLDQQQRTLLSKIAGHIIPRTIEEVSSGVNQWLENLDVKTLQKEVFKHKHIVLLGGAGSGKSFELLKMAVDRNLPKRVPIYIKLNQYEEGLFERCLPVVWQKADPADCLLLLDGLDEIKQDFRTEAIECIYDFSLAFPETRIIISCRTNFFNENEISAKKQLTNFKIYEINDLAIGDVLINATQVSKLGQDGNDFVEQARIIGFSDLLLKPFFLEVLIEYFKQKGSLTRSRNVILEHFVKSNINKDVKRYELDNVQGTVEEEVYILLQRCALVMESIGRNYLLQEELKVVLGTNFNLRLIQHFSLLIRSSDQNGKWSFQHNIIQEYLAAKAIANCDPDEIKSFVSTSPKQQNIKSYWLNTFSLLMSLVNDNTKNELWDWVLSVNPEILVKIEPERFDEERRVMILKYILEDFKLKKLWLRSSYFTEKELSNFSEGPLAFEYLLMELTNRNIPELARMNALQVLRSYNRLTNRQRQRLKTALLTLVDEFTNVYTIDYIVVSLIELNFTDLEVLNKLMMTFKGRRNQFIRTAIYRMIEAAGQVDAHVTYLLEGLTIASSGFGEDRDTTNLLSEGILLKRLIITVKTGAAIRSIIEFFTKHVALASSQFLDDIEEIFQYLTDQAIGLYGQDNSMYTVVVDWAKAFTSSLHENVFQIILVFFNKTGTDVLFFETVWNDRTMKAYTRMILVSELANDFIFANFREKYQRQTISDGDVEELLQLISNNVYNDKMKEKRTIAKRLYETLTGIILPISQEPTDYHSKLQERNQRDFDLLFQPERFGEKLQRLFEKLSLTHISPDDLRHLISIEKSLDINATPRPVLHFIRYFSYGGNLSWDNISKLIQNQVIFHRFIASEINELLTSDATIEVSASQRSFIEDWCRKELNKFSIQGSHLIYDLNTSGRHFNGVNELVWWLYCKFSFELPPEKLLTFTIPTEFHKHECLSVLFTLEARLGREPVLRQVLENIRNKISYRNILINSYTYVMERRPSVVDEYLKIDLLDTNLDIDTKAQLYKLYVDRTSDFSLALELIQELQTNDPFYDTLTMDALKADKQFVIQLLNERLLNPEVQGDNRLNSAVALAKSNEISGINYLVRAFLQDPNAGLEYSALTCLQTVTITLAIPELLRLYILSQTPAFKGDKYETLKRISITGLAHIGCQSEEAFYAVKNAIEQLMEGEKNEPDLHLIIRNVEYQVFDKQQPNLTVRKSLMEIDRMAPLRDSEIVKKMNRNRLALRTSFKTQQLKRWRMRPLWLGIPLLLLCAFYIVMDFDSYLAINHKKGYISDITLRSLSLFSLSWPLIFPAWLGAYLLRHYQPSQIKAYIDLIQYPSHMKDITEDELIHMDRV